MNRELSPSHPAWGRGLNRSVKVLPQHARDHNRALVLTTLTANGVLSRADIARETGLTRVTVSDLVAELIEVGLIAEIGQRTDSRPGKPATLLQVDPNARHVVGVDLSDLREFQAGVFDLKGNLLSKHALATGSERGTAAADLAAEVAARAVAAASAPVLGVGVGAPGIVDVEGVVLTAPNFAWRNLDLQAHLAGVLAIPVHVANDANAAVMAENGFSGGHDDLLLITIGTGVGAGLLLDGAPRLGRRYSAGEIGHVVVGTDEGPLCACGKIGCLEAWLAEPNLRGALAAAPSESAREEVLAEAGRRLGIAIAPVIGALNLTEIALSGPEDLLGGALLDAANEAVRHRMLGDATRHLVLRYTPSSAEVVLRGAAALVMAAELGVG